MSKKYDEFVKFARDNWSKIYPFEGEVVPMFPEISRLAKELDREIRDRAIIEVTKKLTSEGVVKDPSDDFIAVRRLIDNLPIEIMKQDEIKYHQIMDAPTPTPWNSLDDNMKREIRDRHIHSIVYKTYSNGIEITYGEIIKRVENNDAELEYEKSQEGAQRG